MKPTQGGRDDANNTEGPDVSRRSLIPHHMYALIEQLKINETVTIISAFAISKTRTF